MFYCDKEGCSKQGVEFSIPKVTYRFDEKKRKVVPSPELVCSECGSELKEIKKEGFPQIGKFNSLNDQQKKQILGDRAKKHFKQKGEEQKRHIKEQAIKKGLGL
jgi:hypothetical protein